MTHICLVPVRGGSKGLPGKNAAPLIDGLSLLAWTLRQAQRSRLHRQLVVSTEDAALARIAESLGVEVHPRPQALAQDETTTASVVRHVLAERDPEGTQISAITILQATSPLRQTGDIDAALAMFEAGGYDSVVSGCTYEGVHPAKLYFPCHDAVTSVAPAYETFRRQELPPVYRRNGAIFMVRRQHFDQTGCLWGGRTAMLLMPQERSIDIDRQADLDAARAYLRAPDTRTGEEAGRA